MLTHQTKNNGNIHSKIVAKQSTLFVVNQTGVATRQTTGTMTAQARFATVNTPMTTKNVPSMSIPSSNFNAGFSNAVQPSTASIPQPEAFNAPSMIQSAATNPYTSSFSQMTVSSFGNSNSIKSNNFMFGQSVIQRQQIPLMRNRASRLRMFAKTPTEGADEFSVNSSNESQVNIDTNFQDKQFSLANNKKINQSNMDRVQNARLITAIKTPYTSSGRIDLNAFESMVEFQMNNGVEGLVVGGTTGEGHLMNWDEHLTLIEHCCNEYGDKLAIIGNVGSNCTMESMKAANEGFRAGMHSSLIINPYYGKTSVRGIKFHLEQAMDLGPAIIYNVQSRTAQDITPDIMMEIAKHENFAGVKECSGHERIAQYAAEGIKCWSGNDDEAFESRWQHGGHGVISVTSNVLPSVMSKLMTCEDGDKINEKVLPFMNWLFKEPNPIALNTVLAMTGTVNPTFRAPYWPYDKELREEGVKLLEPFLTNEIYGGRPQVMDDGDFTVLGNWSRGVSYIKGDKYTRKW